MTVSVKSKNVHNKACFNAIDEHVIATISLLDILTDIDDVIELIESYINDIAAGYRISQINIIADTRNNKYSNVKNGMFVIDVYYTHANCYNVTRLTYTITR